VTSCERLAAYAQRIQRAATDAQDKVTTLQRLAAQLEVLSVVLPETVADEYLAKHEDKMRDAVSGYEQVADLQTTSFSTEREGAA